MVRRDIKLRSYQARVCERLVRMLMDYEDNDGVKIFEQFKGHIFYNAKKSTPTYPAMYVFVDGGSRDPLAIKRQDWWNIEVKVFMYTKDPSENSMDDHYLWTEGLDRVCRINPHWYIDGEEDLGIHKGDLQNWEYEFAYGEKFVFSETEATINVSRKQCLANKIS
ncbi:MAG: hypothetical protein ACTSSE_08495 [Candidatus Thorarchaeota archaeon]